MSAEHTPEEPTAKENFHDTRTEAVGPIDFGGYGSQLSGADLVPFRTFDNDIPDVFEALADYIEKYFFL